MKKYLLPDTGNFFKANLHCHTTVSDGSLTPEEIKELYKANGYSIVAYTDHDALIGHAELADENFLPLNGYEIQITEESDAPGYTKRTCHICSIALEPDNLIQVGYHRGRYTKDANRGLVKYDENEPDFVRVYNPECVNSFIKKAREAGFFVTYNHPTWSLESYPQYSQYEGMNAMEICNYSCLVEGYDDYNPRVYDDLLRQGKRIYPIAADDNHNRHPFGSPLCDSCGGFTVIKADKLEYRAVTRALEEGKLYASQGPEIKSIAYEDGKVYVSSSPVQRISISYGTRGGTSRYATDGPLTEAVFNLRESCGYFRITVADEHGKPANSRAYFEDELN